MVNRCTLAFAASAIALVTASSTATADPAGPNAVPIAVLAVKSDEALDQAEAFTAALRTAVTSSKGWSLGQANQSLEFLALKMKCIEPIDAACETRIADVINADRVLWAVIEFDTSRQQVVGALHLFVRGKGTSSTEVKFSSRATEATALREAAAALFEKVSGGAPQGGINVTTGGVAAQLYVDDKPIGAVPANGATYQLSVGKHTVTVKAQGYEDVTSEVQVRPLDTVDATFAMTAGARRGSVDGRMLGGFGALAVGIAAGAVGAWAAVDVNGIRGDTGYRAYRDQFTTTDDVCQAARDNQAPRVSNPAASDAASVAALCDRASRDELLQAVGFPVAAVAAGIGGYLLGTSSLGKASDEPHASAWTFVPLLSTTQQTMTVRYTF